MQFKEEKYLYARWEKINVAEDIKKTAKSDKPNFALAATTDEGVFTMADDYGTSYYFRGAVENNYVKFRDFYWRIIRINGDGSLRIIYDGISAHVNGAENINRIALTNVKWNTQANDAKYVGYMFGGSNGSASTSKEQAQTNETNTNIKTQLENWYKTNIRNKGLDEHVADSVYCNDRSTPGKEETGWTNDTGLGYWYNSTAYGAAARLGAYSGGPNYNKPNPSYKCPNKNDAFTKENTKKGNGKLGEKVGLITIDEIIAAGSGKYKNSSYYLYKGNRYWSFSPSFSNDYAYVYLFTNNKLDNTGVSNANGVAPVISLTPEYVSNMIGDGTIGNEYRVK